MMTDKDMGRFLYKGGFSDDFNAIKIKMYQIGVRFGQIAANDEKEVFQMLKCMSRCLFFFILPLSMSTMDLWKLEKAIGSLAGVLGVPEE